MRVLKSLSIFLVIFVLVLGFLILEGNFFSAIIHLRTIIPENTSYNWDELGEVYKYAANNIFDKGYVREVGSEINSRLSSFPDNKPLEKGSLVVPSGSSEGIVKLALPKGFKSGILSLQITTRSENKVGVSYDLKNWKYYDYPGFGMQSLVVVDLGEGELNENVYLKFLPLQNPSLRVYFDVFQYIATAQNERNIYGILFFPEIDIDYEGKEIIQQGIIYDSRTDKSNN